MKHILIADDMPGKLRYMKNVVTAAAPHHSQIHTATTAREAIRKIGIMGKKIDTAVIDFDFEGEHQNGADIVRHMRRANARTRITCATARDGSSFDEARDDTLHAGANDAISTKQEDFEEHLAAFAA